MGGVAPGGAKACVTVVVVGGDGGDPASSSYTRLHTKMLPPARRTAVVQ